MQAFLHGNTLSSRGAVAVSSCKLLALHRMGARVSDVDALGSIVGRDTKLAVAEEVVAPALRYGCATGALPVAHVIRRRPGAPSLAEIAWGTECGMRTGSCVVPPSPAHVHVWDGKHSLGDARALRSSLTGFVNITVRVAPAGGRVVACFSSEGWCASPLATTAAYDRVPQALPLDCRCRDVETQPQVRIGVVTPESVAALERLFVTVYSVSGDSAQLSVNVDVRASEVWQR